jgi:hypothetical protein
MNLKKLQERARVYEVESVYRVYLKATMANANTKPDDFLSSEALNLLFAKDKKDLESSKKRCLKSGSRELLKAPSSYLLNKLKVALKENRNFDEVAMIVNTINESTKKNLEAKKKKFRRYPSKALASWLAEIATEPKKPPVSRGAAYASALRNLSSNDVKKIMDELRKLQTEKSNLSLGEAEMYFAQIAEPEKAKAKAKSFFTKLSSDESIPEVMKFFFLSNYLLKRKAVFDKMPDEADKCVKIFMAQALKQKPDKKKFYGIFNIYNINTQPDSWAMAAGVLCDFWDKNYSKDLKGLPLNAATGLLEMQLKLGRIDKAKSFLKENKKLAANPQSYIALLNYKQYKLLADTLKENKSRLEVNNTSPFICRFSPELARNLEEAKPFLKNDGERLQLELLIKAFMFYNSSSIRRHTKWRPATSSLTNATMLPASYYVTETNRSCWKEREKSEKEFIECFERLDPQKICDIETLSECINLGWGRTRLHQIKKITAKLAMQKGIMDKLDEHKCFDAKQHCLDALLEELYETQDFDAIFEIFDKEKERIKNGYYKKYAADAIAMKRIPANKKITRCILYTLFKNMKNFMSQRKPLKNPPPLDKFGEMCDFIVKSDPNCNKDVLFVNAAILYLQNKPEKCKLLLNTTGLKSYSHNAFIPFEYANLTAKSDKEKVEIFNKLLQILNEKAMNKTSWDTFNRIMKFPYSEKNPLIYKESLLNFYKDAIGKKEYIEKYYRELKPKKKKL